MRSRSGGAVKVAVVAGNLKRNSRTLEAGIMVAKKLVGREPDVIVDVFDLGPAIFDFNNQVIAKSIETVLESDIAVFASPTFKGSYSGILKAYLDQIPSDGLRNIVCLPVMLGASLHHAMAPDLLLKPVLVELGALCPAAGIYLIDKTFADDPRLDLWIDRVKTSLCIGGA
jgi:FMN reductase